MLSIFYFSSSQFYFVVLVMITTRHDSRFAQGATRKWNEENNFRLDGRTKSLPQFLPWCKFAPSYLDCPPHPQSPSRWTRKSCCPSSSSCHHRHHHLQEMSILFPFKRQRGNGSSSPAILTTVSVPSKASVASADRSGVALLLLFARGGS